MHNIDRCSVERNPGSVSFGLPMGVDAGAYDSVVIWCKNFNVEIGRATLPDTMMK